MPNWCINFIEILGPSADLRKFRSELQTSTSEYTGRFVHPEVLSTHAPLDGDWDYEEACRKWSTKWDFDLIVNSYIEDADGNAVLDGQFDTAWAPATNGWWRIAGKFPSLTFIVTFYEPGMCFYGHDIYENGDHVDEFSDDLPDFPVVDDDWESQWNKVVEFFDNYTDNTRASIRSGMIHKVTTLSSKEANNE